MVTEDRFRYLVGLVPPGWTTSSDRPHVMPE